MKWMHILKDTYNQAHSKEKKKTQKIWIAPYLLKINKFSGKSIFTSNIPNIDYFSGDWY